LLTTGIYQQKSDLYCSYFKENKKNKQTKLAAGRRVFPLGVMQPLREVKKTVESEIILTKIR
jgi:hypothetical protein